MEAIIVFQIAFRRIPKKSALYQEKTFEFSSEFFNFMLEFIQLDPKFGYPCNPPGTAFRSNVEEMIKREFIFKAQYLNGPRFQNVKLLECDAHHYKNKMKKYHSMIREKILKN